MTAPAEQTPQQIDEQLAELWQREMQLRNYAHGTRKSLERYANVPFEVERMTAQIAEYDRELDEIADKAAPLKAEYARRRWSRFFLVTNTGGHVHSSMECTTCFDTTRFAWLPELSGRTEAEAVAAYGETICTVCFPSAPTLPAWQQAVADREAAEKAKADAECPGSRTYDHGSERAQYCSPSAICTHCGQSVSLTSSGKLRAHKRAAA